MSNWFPGTYDDAELSKIKSAKGSNPVLKGTKEGTILVNGWRKNLLKNTAVTQTINGVTFTVNADGTITANGTAEAKASLNVTPNLDIFKFVNKKIIFSSSPEGMSNETYYGIYTVLKNNIYQFEFHEKNKNGLKIEPKYQVSNGNQIAFSVAVAKGYTANNVVFKPMLEEIPDGADESEYPHPYVPYAYNITASNADGTKSNTIQVTGDMGAPVSLHGYDGTTHITTDVENAEVEVTYGINRPGSNILQMGNNIGRVNIITSASNHNNILGKRDLTNIYTIDEICQQISDGTFEDLYIGDYFDITISSTYTANEVVRCAFAGFDTYWNNGDVAFNKHHAVIVTKNCMATKAKMNPTNTTEGGFAGSDMRKTVLPNYKTAFQSVFGNHLLTHRTILTSAMNPDLNSNAGAGLKGASSNHGWFDTTLSLLSEIQVYGFNAFSSSWYDIGCDNLQLPLFALDPTARVCGKNTTTDGNGDGNRQWYWLRNVASLHGFACFHHNGASGGDDSNYLSSSSGGVRPVFCIG